MRRCARIFHFGAIIDQAIPCGKTKLVWIIGVWKLIFFVICNLVLGIFLIKNPGPEDQAFDIGINDS
jgi:hypothetical protein